MAEGEIAVASRVRPVGIFYGWVMLPLAMLAMFASSPGQTFGVSIFNETIRETLHLSHSQFAFAYMLGTILGAIPIALIGSQMDRHGMRVVMLVSLSAFCGSCLVFSFVGNWWSLLLGFFLLRMLGPGTLGFLSGNVLAFWFERRLGSVESIRQLSASISIAIVPALNVWLMTFGDWRSAYLVWGIGLWVVLFPVFFALFRNRPEDLGQSIDHEHDSHHDSFQASTKLENLPELTFREAVKTPAFRVVTAGTAMFSMIVTAIVFSLVSILADQGLSKQDAATTLTMSALMMGVSQLCGGFLADRVPTKVMVFIGLVGLSVSMLSFQFTSTLAAARLAGAMMGIAQGLYFSSTQPMWPRYFGRKHLGQIRGVVMSLMVAASSLGPLIAGVSRDLAGSYLPVLILFAAMPLPVAFCSFIICPPKPSVGVSS